MLLLLEPPSDRSGEVTFNVRAEAAARGVHPDRIQLDERLERAEHNRVSEPTDGLMGGKGWEVRREGFLKFQSTFVRVDKGLVP